MGYKRLTSSEINKIHDLHGLGLNNVMIAEFIGCDEKSVRYHLEQERPEHIIEAQEKLSQKKKTVQRLDNLVEILLEKMKNLKDVEITKPGDVLKAAELIESALGMMYGMTPEGTDGVDGAAAPSEKLSLKQLKAIKELPEDVRNKLLEELSGT